MYIGIVHRCGIPLVTGAGLYRKDVLYGLFRVTYNGAVSRERMIKKIYYTRNPTSVSWLLYSAIQTLPRFWLNKQNKNKLNSKIAHNIVLYTNISDRTLFTMRNRRIESTLSKHRKKKHNFAEKKNTHTHTHSENRLRRPLLFSQKKKNSNRLLYR